MKTNTNKYNKHWEKTLGAFHTFKFMVFTLTHTTHEPCSMNKINRVPPSPTWHFKD